MTSLLQIGQIGSALLLIVVILLQQRGTALGGAFGGTDMSYRSRRGVEQLLLRITVILAAVFIVSAIAQLFI